MERPILSPMQEWIAQLIHEGYTNGQIAVQTGQKTGTVRNITTYIYRKIVPEDFIGNRRVFCAIWVEKHKCEGSWPPMKTIVEDDMVKDGYDYPKKGTLNERALSGK